MLINEYCPNIEVIAKADGVDSAYQLIQELQPELIFLDIRMPSGSEGFELLSKFDDPSFMVVFATAFKDYAIEAMNANAIHYILKPIDIDDLIKACDKVTKLKNKMDQNPKVWDDYLAGLKQVYQSNETTRKISISHAKGIKLVSINTILYIEAKSNCSVLHFTDGSQYLDTRTLAVYENLLPDQSFYRVHRSYIVNTDFISEYRRDIGHYVIMDNGEKLPVSRKRVTGFLSHISQ